MLGLGLEKGYTLMRVMRLLLKLNGLKGVSVKKVARNLGITEEKILEYNL